MRHGLRSAAWVLALAVPSWAGAQARRASPATFSIEELRRVVGVLAHDSMAGRATPSPGLEASARFIAAGLETAGLVPLGDDGTFFQRYPVLETILRQDSTRIDIGDVAHWSFGKDYFYGGGQGTSPFGTIRGDAVIVSGTVTAENARSLGLAGKVVLYVPAPGARRDAAYRSIFAMGASGLAAVVAAGSMHDSTWRQLSSDPDEHKPMTAPAWSVWTAQKPAGHVYFLPVLELWRQRFGQMLQRAGVDTSILRDPSGAPRVTPLNVEGVLRFPREVLRVSSPANVVAMLPGGDPILRHEYIVITAHFDGLGRMQGGPPGPDGILNGADDNASGTAALLRIAKAFAEGPRPKRSVIFAAVSGEEVGLWGSDYFASRPPVPRASIVANVNLDMIGRPAGDSVYVFGRVHPVIGAVANTTLRRRGARRLVILDEAAFARRYPGEPIADRSDHANFTRRGIPSISFFTGWHDDYHTAGDDVDKVDYDALSRIARIAYEIAVDIANASLRR